MKSPETDGSFDPNFPNSHVLFCGFSPEEIQDILKNPQFRLLVEALLSDNSDLIEDVPSNLDDNPVTSYDDNTNLS